MQREFFEVRLFAVRILLLALARACLQRPMKDDRSASAAAALALGKRARARARYGLPLGAGAVK